MRCWRLHVCWGQTHFLCVEQSKQVYILIYFFKMILYSFLETNINNYELLKLLRTTNFFKKAESTKEPRFWTCTDTVSSSTCWTGGVCLAERWAFGGPCNPHHPSSVLCPRLDLWVECVLPAISVRSSGMTGGYSGFQLFSSPLSAGSRGT